MKPKSKAGIASWLGWGSCLALVWPALCCDGRGVQLQSCCEKKLFAFWQPWGADLWPVLCDDDQIYFLLCSLFVYLITSNGLVAHGGSVDIVSCPPQPGSVTVG